jgi:hypothetical protein
VIYVAAPQLSPHFAMSAVGRTDRGEGEPLTREGVGILPLYDLDFFLPESGEPHRWKRLHEFAAMRGNYIAALSTKA